MKFEIIIPYYKRPTIVLNALDSVKNSFYKDWHLTLIDDSGDDSFKETFFNFGFNNKKITYVPIMMSDAEKIKVGGAIFGKYMNEAIENTDADVIITLCDDDALLPDYMTNLKKFYEDDPEQMWGYCHVKYFDPRFESYKDAKLTPDNPNLNYPFMNANTGSINPHCRVDGSQVTFRTEAFVDDVWFPYPQTANLDASIFNKMFNRHGGCKFIGTYGQCKGWFDEQLGVKQRAGKAGYIDL